MSSDWLLQTITSFSSVPGIFLATDFICAFPTETEEDFKESLSLLEEYRFDSVFINQYYARPNTPAARFVSYSPVR